MEEELSALPITCNICKRKFSQKDDLSSHMKFAHFGMRDAVHEDTTASEVIDLDDDDSTDDSDNNDTTIDFGSLCKICYSIFRDNEDLEAHTRLAHPKNTETDQKMDFAKTPVVDDNVADEAVFMEDDAPRAAESLVTASEEDTDKDIDDEVIFDAQTTTSMDVNWHENYGRTVCNICVEEFENKAALSAHIKSAHFGISCYKCAMCSKSFESRDDVIKHYNVCTGENQNKNTKRRDEKMKKCDKKKISSNKPRLRSRKSRSKKKPIPPPSEYAYVKVTKLYKKQKLVKKCLKQRLDHRKKRDVRKVSDEMRKTIVQSKPQSKSKKKVKDPTNKEVKYLRPCSKSQVKSKKKVKDPKNKKIKSLRPCFICREEYFLGAGHMLGHGVFLFEHLTPDQESNIASLHLQIKFKCLRCGKVGTLLTIQHHLQEICLRGPFKEKRLVEEFFCTVCGERFVTFDSHDEHVASVHYSHLYGADSGHFAYIPFPHILVYYVSPNVCQHCGEMCKFTMHGNSQATCIEGPYICPYPHTMKQSRCTLDLLLFHTKACECKPGVLALQCNNCFKMLLCNSSPEQVDQLKEIIEHDYLECCASFDKSFKCYCCNYDFPWNVITRELRISLNLLHYVNRSFRSLEQIRNILSNNPSIHGKGNPIKQLPIREVVYGKVKPIKQLPVKEVVCRKVNPIKLPVKEAERTLIDRFPSKNERPHMFRRMQTDAIKKKLESKAESISPGQEDNMVFHQPSQKGTVSKPLVGPDPMPLKIINVFRQTSEALTVSNNVENSSIVQSTPAKPESRAQAPISKIFDYGVRKIEQNDLNAMYYNKERQPVRIKHKRTAVIITESRMVDDDPAMMTLEEKREIDQYLEYNCTVQETTPQPNATNITDCNTAVLEEENEEEFAQVIEENWSGGKTIARARAMNTSAQSARSTISIINMIGTNGPDSSTMSKDGEKCVKLRFCTICSKSVPEAFHDEESFLMHMLQHELNSQFGNKCYDCSMMLGSRTEWRLHIKFKHPHCIILKCHYEGCSEEFQRPQDLQDHMMSEHNHLFGCITCLHMFDSEEELQLHYTLVHSM